MSTRIKRFTALTVAFAAAGLASIQVAPHVAAATTITNPSFESGLTGWTGTGTAFTAGAVSTQTTYWNRSEYGQHNFWHVFSGPDNSKTGTLESETFMLGGNGTIDLLTAGTNDPAKTYVALVSSGGTILGTVTGPGNDTYVRQTISAPAAVGTMVKIRAVDNSITGHLGIDDVNVPPTASLNSHVEPALYNHDFELAELTPSSIKGWTSSGNAFAVTSLTHNTLGSDGGPFRQNGARHLWGFAANGDAAVGTLRSTTFTLSGNGGIDFLIGGGDDPTNLYVALRKASDNSLLFKATGSGSEAYRRVFWNAAAYLGQDLYIDIVDTASGGFGHINADDFRVLNSPFATNLAKFSLDEGTGAITAEASSGDTTPVNFFLNTGTNQPAKPPLWRPDGIRGAALQFDGYSTWIARTADKNPAPTTALTVRAWVAPTSFEHGDEGRLSTIVGQQDREAKKGFVLGNYRHGTWGLHFGTGSDWREVMSGRALPLNEWSQVSATYDSATGQARLYLNGELAGAADFPSGQPITPANVDLSVGRNTQGMWLYGYTMNSFAGLIDELAISPSAMTAMQISSAYAADLTANGGNLPTSNTTIGRELLAADSQKPQFHASPPFAWQNEPSGPIYYNGQYHVFYQRNPRGPYWNHIRWGHLVSTDMVHWRDAKDAIGPGGQDIDPDGAWAGGSTLDGNGRPVLFYTAGDDRESPNQRINLARSTVASDGDNDLNTWTKSPNVVVNQGPGEGIPGEFRDPFVFKSGSTWFMLVTSGIKSGSTDVGGTALIYSTTDPTLAAGWTYRGPLYTGDYVSYPQTGRVWELPNLLPLGSSGKWVFLINPAKMARDEYQSRYTYYWIGTFNPTTAKFTPDSPTPQLVDVGEHFTGPAGSVTPDGRTVLYTIAQGRRTATMDYNAGYAHSFGAPMELSLRADGRLGVAPIGELTTLRGTPLVNITADTTYAAANTALTNVSADMLDVELTIDPGLANEVGLEVLRSPGAEERTRIYFKRSSQEFTVDRTASSLNPDVEKWFQLGTVDPGTGLLTFRMLIDRSLIETYLGGLKSLTTRAYPTRSDAKGIRVWANSDTTTVTIKSLKIWPMASAYPSVTPTAVTVNPATASLPVGDRIQLTANVAPQNASNKEVVWTSSNPAVATVSNGRVLAKAVGTAIITAATRLGARTGAAAITVTAAPAHNGLTNDSFESGLTGWTTTGTAFTAADVTTASTWGWGGPFLFDGAKHLWGIAAGGTNPDDRTGTLQSATVTLGGNGQVDFLLGGGNDPYRLRAELIRASDNAVLYRATGWNQESYTRVSWDASTYIGTAVYFRVTDTDTGSWAHLNVDDVNVPVAP